MKQAAAETIKVGDQMFRKSERWSGEVELELVEVLRVSHRDGYVYLIQKRLGFPEGTKYLRTTGAYAFGYQVPMPEGA